MNITSELRKWASEEFPLGSDFNNDIRAGLDRVIDRIDMQHDDDLERVQDVGIGAALDLATSEQLEAHDLVRLPVDADGKVWRLKDKIADSEGHEAYTVGGYKLDSRGWQITTHGYYMGFEPEVQRHYVPSLADRIRAIADELEDGGNQHEFTSDLYDIASELEGDDE